MYSSFAGFVWLSVGFFGFYYQMTCLSCARWNLRESGKMACLGFAVCDLGQKYEYTSREFSCDRFKALNAEKVKAREEWLDKKQKG